MPSDDFIKEPAVTGTFSGAREILGAFGRLLRHEARLLVLILLALIATEEILRLTQPRLAGLIYSANMTGGHRIALTPEGYRIPPGEPPEGGKPIILGIGDSTTFGTGVGAAQTWPMDLAADFGPGASIRNGGAEGAEPREFVTGLRGAWANPTPDAVVLLVTPNMISFTDFRWDNDPRDPRDRQRRLTVPRSHGLEKLVSDAVQSSALWKAVTLDITFAKFRIGLLNHEVNPDHPLSPLMAYGWVQPDVPAEDYDRMWERFGSAMRDLADLTRAQGSCLVIGYLPPRFTLSDNVLDNMKAVPKDRLPTDAGARVRELAKTLDIPFAETEEALKEARETQGPVVAPLYIPGDYTHLDPEGHAIVAARFAQTLAPILQDNAPCHFNPGK